MLGIQQKKTLLFSFTGNASQPVLWRALKARLYVHIRPFPEPYLNAPHPYLLEACKIHFCPFMKSGINFYLVSSTFNSFYKSPERLRGCLKSRGKFPRRKKEIDLSYQKALHKLVNKFDCLAYMELNDKLKLFS